MTSLSKIMLMCGSLVLGYNAYSQDTLTVKKGDFLWKIAKEMLTPTEKDICGKVLEIQKENNLSLERDIGLVKNGQYQKGKDGLVDSLQPGEKLAISNWEKPRDTKISMEGSDGNIYDFNLTKAKKELTDILKFLNSDNVEVFDQKDNSYVLFMPESNTKMVYKKNQYITDLSGHKRLDEDITIIYFKSKEIKRFTEYEKLHIQEGVHSVDSYLTKKEKIRTDPDGVDVIELSNGLEISAKQDSKGNDIEKRYKSRVIRRFFNNIYKNIKSKSEDIIKSKKGKIEAYRDIWYHPGDYTSPYSKK